MLRRQWCTGTEPRVGPAFRSKCDLGWDRPRLRHRTGQCKPSLAESDEQFQQRCADLEARVLACRGQFCAARAAAKRERVLRERRRKGEVDALVAAFRERQRELRRELAADAREAKCVARKAASAERRREVAAWRDTIQFLCGVFALLPVLCYVAFASGFQVALCAATVRLAEDPACVAPPMWRKPAHRGRRRRHRTRKRRGARRRRDAATDAPPRTAAGYRTRGSCVEIKISGAPR